jgi:obg-like ATPase 1
MPPKKTDEGEGSGGGGKPSSALRFGRNSGTLCAGLVGLPNVGKSSLFNILTQSSVPAENFPFCTVEPNTSRCAVPDARYDHLLRLWKPASEYPAFLKVVDIAGLIKGASEGAGLGNAFLSHIQAVDSLIHVVRAFESDDIVHVDDSVDPCRDLATIIHELCQKDLTYVAAAEAAAIKDVKKTPGYKLPIRFYDVMTKVRELLEKDLPVRDGEWTGPEVETIREKLGSLITTKPVLYVVNLSKADFLRKRNKHLAAISAWVASHGGGAVIPLSVEWEAELAAAGPPGSEARAAFLAAAGEGVKSAVPRVILTSYRELSLAHFFTAGEKEVRCWTVPAGTAAPEAAGEIHSDFVKNFIAAEVCSYADFAATAPTAKGFADVKAAGKLRTEGRAYIVQDGDIIQFKIGQAAGGGKK